MVIDHSRHEHYGAGRDSDRIPLIRRITDEDVTGFVGRDDELKWLAERLSPDAPRGGPLLLCPQDNQAKIGVTDLALQAASRALAAGWFPGGAVLVTPHPGDKERDIDLAATMTEVLAQLGVLAGRHAVGPADYQDAMDGLAAQGRPVLIVIENAWESDASLVLGLRLASRPHRMLMTAWQPRHWMNSPRRLDVRYLTEDESVEVLATTLAAEHGRGVDSLGPPAHLRALARRCHGVAGVLKVAARELGARPELTAAGLIQALADSYDRGPGAAPPDRQPASLSRSLAAMAEPLRQVWGPVPDLSRLGPPVIGRRGLMSWVLADVADGRPFAWDVIAGPGTGKTTLLSALQAALAAAGARVVFFTLERAARAYEERLAGSRGALPTELARAAFSAAAALAVGEKLTPAERLAVDQEVNRADQDIRRILDRPAGQDGATIADLLIPRGSDDPPPPLDPATDAACARQVHAVRTELARRVAGILRRLAPGAAPLAVLADNLHLVTDAACRQWLADLFLDRLEAVTLVTRRPGEQAFCDAAVPYQLPNFTRAETLEYLRRAGWAGPDEVWSRPLDAMMASTQGRPQAVALQWARLTGPVTARVTAALTQAVTDVISQEPSLSTEAVDESVAATVHPLVADACRVEVGRDLPAVAEFLTVLRRVNAGLLGELLSADGVTADQANRLAARLSRIPAMTRSDDDDQESFRLHDHIRSYWENDLPPGTERARHEQAAQLYERRVEGYEDSETLDIIVDGDGATVTAWARFESPGFQAVLREWLFHAMRAQGKELSQQTGIRITQVFLEAFVWWGWYLPSDVCEQMLREFRKISATSALARRWLGDLSTLYLNYRRGFTYSGQQRRDWNLVGPALLRVRRFASVSSGRSMEPGRRSIDIITTIFLAQAAAYRPGGDPQEAVTLFDQAREAVRRSVADGYPGHEWHDGWIVFFTGEMWSHHGQPDRAAAALRDLDALAAADTTDHELFDKDLAIRTAHLQCEAYLAFGADAEAVDACARAALLTYAYHVDQETPVQPPNEYTYTLHLEAIARAEACLARVRDRDAGAWRDGIQRMCDHFAPYWQLAGGPGAGQYVPPPGPLPADGPALPGGIIPPPPEPGDPEHLDDPDRPCDLGTFDSPFAELATLVKYELAPQLDNWVPFRQPEAK